MKGNVEVLCHEKEGKQHAYTKIGSNMMTPSFIIQQLCCLWTLAS